VGIGFGTPGDEYDFEAGRLAARLRQTDGDVTGALDGLFGKDEALLTKNLSLRVSAAWKTFLARTLR
jgi:hypothetical protein